MVQPDVAPAASPEARVDRHLWHILTVATLVGACLMITRPFLLTLLWAIILAVSAWPSFVLLRRTLGGRQRLAAGVFVAFGIVVLLLPLLLAGMSVVRGAPWVMANIETVEHTGLPGPPAAVGHLPLVGAKLQEYWAQVSAQGSAALTAYRAEINGTVRWLLIRFGSFGLTMLQFLLAIIIAGLLLVRAGGASAMLEAFAERIGGAQAVELIPLAAHTIRAVSFGVVGTSLVEGVVAALGYVIAGMPAAVLLGGATFLFCLLQAGPGVVFLGAAAWVWYQGSVGWAIFILVWNALLVLPVELFGRPAFISRGTGLPLLLIFVGVLGGLLAFGFIGVFVGATVLAVSYTLLLKWLAPANKKPAPTGPV